MNDYFDKVYCINLVRRKDRLERFQQELVRVNWPFREPIIWQATDGYVVPNPPNWKGGGGAYGCWHSWMSILALVMSDPTIKTFIVMEDDCFFTPHFEMNVIEFLSNVPPDYDAIWLGGQHLAPPQAFAPGIVRCMNTQRTHAVILRNNQYLKDLYKGLLTFTTHLDHYMGSISREYKIYAPEPFLAGQNDSRSDILCKDQNKRLWSTCPTDQPIVLLETNKQIRDALTDYLHFGWSCNADGVDKGIADAFKQKDPFPKLSNWVKSWGSEGWIEGKLTAIYHPGATLELVQRCHNNVIHIKTNDLAEAKAQVESRQTADRPAEPPIILLKAKKDVALKLREYGWHQGYYCDTITKIDNGLREIFDGEVNLDSLARWILLVGAEVKMNGYLTVWHPSATKETLEKCTKRPIIEIEGETAEECLAKLHHEPNTIVINHGAGGLGDAVLGMLPLCSLKQDNPDKRLIYKVGPPNIPFIQLFHGPDKVTAHDFDDNKDEPPNRVDMQINVGYNDEIRTRSPITRVERYRKNIGASGLIMPKLKEPERIKELGKAYEGVIALAPFSTYANREYPVVNWLTVCRLLKDKRYRTVILDKEDRKREKKAEIFAEEKIINGSAELVTGIIMNCAALVGCDSGLQHLGGVLDRPTIALCAQTIGNQIFGVYPSVTSLQGTLDCANGCFWQAPYHSKYCEPLCSGLASISPQTIVSEIDRLCLPPICGMRAVINHHKLGVLRDYLISTSTLDGSIGEFGSYKGGVLKLMSHFAPDAEIHSWDTFAGMPDDDTYGLHKKGDFSDTSLEEVSAFVNNPRVQYHVGTFPDTAVDNIKFKLVHVDMDGYESTKSVIEYIRGKMIPGGIALFDDFSWFMTPGIQLSLIESGLKHEQIVEGMAMVQF